jgi:hypothetical protein
VRNLDRVQDGDIDADWAAFPKRKITVKFVPKAKTRYYPSEVKTKSLRLTASKRNSNQRTERNHEL